MTRARPADALMRMPLIDEIRVGLAGAASLEEARSRAEKLLRLVAGLERVAVRLPDDAPPEAGVAIALGARRLGRIDAGRAPAPAERHLLEAVAAELARAWVRWRRTAAPGLATRAVHAGEASDARAKPAHPPLHDSVFYEFDSAADLEAYLAEPSRAYIYTRWENPTIRAAEEKLARIAGAEAARFYATGSAAIATVTLGLARSGQRIVRAGALYGGTMHFFHDWLPRFGIAVDAVEVDDHEGFRRALARPEVVFGYTETISNPTLRVADLDALGVIAQDRGVPLVVDHTFATPLLCQAARHGVTLSIESATKGLGGHGDLMGGVVTGALALVDRLDRETARHLGGTAGPYEAHMLARGLKTFPLRFARQCDSAMAVARALAEDGRVAGVSYPGLPSHKDHALARRLFDATSPARFGNMVTFDAGSAERARAFFDAAELIRRAASLASVDSLMSLPVLTSHHGLPVEELRRHGITPGLVRLSIGIEDPDDLIADIRRALDAAAG